MPSKSRKNIGLDQDVNTLPDLNEAAVQTLSQKIQDNLHGSSKAPIRASTARSKKENALRKAKATGEPSVNGAKSNAVANEQRKAKPAQSNSVGRTNFEQTQGKKRLRNGLVKESRRNDKLERNNPNAVQLGSGPVKRSFADDGALEGEVLALGGTKADLDLVGEVLSGSELDGDEGVNAKGRDVGLKKELLQMVQGLGIPKADSRVLEDAKYSDEDDNYNDDDVMNKHGEKTVDSQSYVIRDRVPAHTRLEKDDVQPVGDKPKPRTKGKSQLIFQPLSEWHSVNLPSVPQPKQEPRALPVDLSDRVHEYAKALLEKENSEYAAHHGFASSEHKFYSTLMSSGTLSDKISALTLSVQESPLHNTKALENLVGLAGKRSRDQAVNVLGALKDLFGPGNLLPSDRRLRSFASQPSLAAAFGSGTFHSWTSSSPLPKSLQKIHLLSFAYEDWLKTMFFEVLKILERWCNDEVPYARGKAVDYVFSLLKDKPEQEANLLRLLVNKLGDSDKKIASKTSFNILRLETAHPLMKPTIISAIESDILFKPHQTLHAQYYAVITLNQTVLSTKEEAAVRQLLDIYFSLFAKLLRQPAKALENSNSKAPTVEKIVVNRKGEVQGGGGAAGKKALKKQKATEKSTAVEDDLQEKMLSAVLTGVNRAIPYTTTNDGYLEAHMDTIYLVTHSSSFNTSVQALMLIQQMNGVSAGSQDRFYRGLYESLLDPRLLTSSKQTLYLNLLFRALRSDLDVNRVKAFGKRLLQVAAMHQPPFVCGVLYLLRELENVFPSLASLIDEPEDDASDHEESFHDVDDARSASPKAADTATEWASAKHSKYDPRKRDPIHAGAATSPLWELPALTQHYHPSISLFSARLLNHSTMPPKPDLRQNTLISFLDRFVYKNPKTGGTAKAKGTSIMQPLSGGEDGSVLLSAHSGTARRALPVNSDAFWRQKGENVGPDEVFFHKYFSTIKRKEEKKKDKKAKKSSKGGDDEDSDKDEEEEEAEIWKALAESRPEIEGDDNDVDMDLSDHDELAAAMDEEESDLSALDDDDDDDDGTGSDDSDGLSDLEDRESRAELENDEQPLSDHAEIFGRDETPKAIAMGGRKKGEDRKSEKRRLKGLPTFASAEDYAKMLADESDEDGI